VVSPVACELCGQAPLEPADGTAPADGDTAAQVPLTWLTSVERGRVKVYCAGCARTHLRAIESKLDSAWW
jgi:ribosomal protein S27E